MALKKRTMEKMKFPVLTGNPPVTVSYPYDCPQQTRLYSVLLVPVWDIPLNENTHH